MKMTLYNKDVIEMVRRAGVGDCVGRLLEQGGHGMSASSLHNKVKRLKGKVRDLQKTKKKKTQLEELLEEPFFHIATSTRRPEAANLKAQIVSLKLRLQVQRAELRRKSSKISFCWKKIRKQEENEALLKQKIATLEEENLHLHVEFNQQRKRLSDVEDLVDFQNNDGHRVQMKQENGYFTNATKECVFKLLDCNVSTGQVGPVMESVMTFAHCIFDDLPSKSTVNEWHVSRLILAQKQLLEKLGPNQSLPQKMPSRRLLNRRRRRRT
jgi:regulator of replication initiation timing